MGGVGNDKSNRQDASLLTHTRGRISALADAVSSPGALALLIAAVAFLAFTAFRLRSSYLGDPLIYAPYVDNIVHGDFFSFNPGEFSSGSTSPLWPLLLAIPYAVVPKVATLKVVGAAATVVAYVVTFLAVRRTVRSEIAAAIGSLAILASLAGWGFFFYESPLVVFLIAVSMLVGQRVIDQGSAPSGRMLVTLGVLWAALPLSRPDAVLLVLLEVVGLIWIFRASAARRIVGVAAVSLVPFVTYAAYSKITLGTWSTSSAARSFYFEERVEQLFAGLQFSNNAYRYVISISGVLVVAGIGLLLMIRERRTRPVAMFALAGIVLYIVLLVFIQPVDRDENRYLLPILPFVCLGIAGALKEVFARLGTTVLKVSAGIIVFLALFLQPIADLTTSAHTLSTLGINLDYIRDRSAQDILAREAGDGDVVLAYEVQIRYGLRDDLSVLSLDGTTDGKVIPYLDPPDVDGFLRRYRPEWWVSTIALDQRPYLAGSTLQRIRNAFVEDPDLETKTIHGIRFELVARNPDWAIGAAGWDLLFRLRFR